LEVFNFSTFSAHQPGVSIRRPAGEAHVNFLPNKHMADRKITIDLKLNCSQQEASDLLAQSVENIFLPWFMSRTNIKGIVSNSSFHIWPNTLYSGISDIGITGRIIPDENHCKIEAFSRILPPFSYFKQSISLNWLVGFIMVASWLAVVVAMVTDNIKLLSFSMYLLVPSIAFVFLQFTKYIQAPELIDIEKKITKIFEQYIEKS
jgi:hypothetical protein